MEVRTEIMTALKFHLKLPTVNVERTIIESNDSGR